MKYSNLSHEERELVLYIQNNEQAYRAIDYALLTDSKLLPIVKQCGINYKRMNANVNDFVFSNKNYKNVAEYFKNKDD